MFAASLSTLMVSSIFYGADGQATNWPKYLLAPVNTLIPLMLLPMQLAGCKATGLEKPSSAESTFPPLSLQELNEKRREDLRKSLKAMAYPFAMSTLMFALSRSESARIATGISMATPFIASLFYLNRFGDLTEEEYRQKHQELLVELYPLWTPPNTATRESIGGLALTINLP
jgi:hypothetical protein